MYTITRLLFPVNGIGDGLQFSIAILHYLHNLSTFFSNYQFRIHCALSLIYSLTLLLNHVLNWALLVGIDIVSLDKTTWIVRNATTKATWMIELLVLEAMFLVFNFLFLGVYRWFIFIRRKFLTLWDFI